MLKAHHSILIILITLFSTQQTFAGHGMGGELTWTCLPTGQFKFQVKFYRDCNNIAGPASISLQTTVPGVPSISLPLFDQNDISPSGLSADGTTSCLTCSQGNLTSPSPGLVEEFIYQSAPINLPGVPPATGWRFSWNDCCRSSTITNISNAGGIGLMIRAVMYPYMGITNTPCFDSSPYFAEKPTTIVCTGYPFIQSVNAVDPEMDSLVYSWGNPLDDAGNNIPFAPGYNVNSQLPSPAQNPLNVTATIHPHTGEVRFTSFTGGKFVTNVKVTAYKCGIKVAEIFRETQLVLSNSCAPILIGQNLPPVISAPFIDPVTGLQTSYSDTVNAGDTVNFMFAVSDFDIFSNGLGQIITISGSGAQFGSNFTDPNAGCLIPPCATVASGLPIAVAIGGQINFNWITTCAHAIGNPGQCYAGPITYTFILSAGDNYCPANASVAATISITVLETPIPNVVASISQDSLCFYGPPELLTGSPAGGIWSGPGVIGNVFTPFDAGTGLHEIIYTITDSSGCSGTDTVSVVVNVCTGLNEFIPSELISVHPNPVHDKITISVNENIDSTILLEVYNVYGSKVMDLYSGNLIQFGSNQTYDMSVLNKGVYFVKLSGGFNSITSFVKY